MQLLGVRPSVCLSIRLAHCYSEGGALSYSFDGLRQRDRYSSTTATH